MGEGHPQFGMNWLIGGLGPSEMIRIKVGLWLDTEKYGIIKRGIYSIQVVLQARH